MRKTIACADCRVEFTYEHEKGPTRQRCDECRARRKSETDRAKSARYRERDPERAREQYNRYNRKRLADPEFLRKKREDHDRRVYGIEPEHLQAMRDSQGDRCAICKGERCGPGDRLHVDHDHVTGKVRALLCSRCNTMIGLAGDDPARLSAAAAYIRRHRKEASDG